VAITPGVHNPTWSEVMRRSATICYDDGREYNGSVTDHIILYGGSDRVVIRGEGSAPPPVSRMHNSTITVSANGGGVLRVTGHCDWMDIDSGWRVVMALHPELLALEPASVLHEFADVAIGERHYGGQVTEYHPAEGRIVVEGQGPAPA
jgi:hypothetical protein